VPVQAADSASSKLRHSLPGKASWCMIEKMKKSTLLPWEHEPETKGV